MDFAGWRAAARAFALNDVPPENIVWSVGEPTDLFADNAALPEATAKFTVSRALLELAETVIQARDPERFALLYALVWRVHRGEKHLLEDVADPTVQRVQRLAQAVRRDTHKMRAFLRFRAVDETGDATRYVAWFEPTHCIVEAERAVFRAAVRHDDVVDPDAVSQRALEWRGAQFRAGRGAGRGAG